MKTLTTAIFAASLMMFPLSALACDPSEFNEPVEELVGWLISDFGEQPLVALQSEDGYELGIIINPETESWTVIKVNESNFACIDDFGVGVRLIQ